MEHLLKLTVCGAVKADMGSLHPACTEYRVVKPVRRMGVVTITVLCVVFLLSPTVRADNPFATGAYPVGWWGHMGSPGNLVDIYYGGGNTVLAYWSTASPLTRVQFLNEAEAGGMRVIVEVDPVFINTQYAAGIRDLVSIYDDYPAVAGWCTGDEPYWMGGLSLSKMQIAYDAIKEEKDLFGKGKASFILPEDINGLVSVITSLLQYARDQGFVDEKKAKTAADAARKLLDE